MSSHKNHEHLNTIKEAVEKTDQLSQEQKSESFKRLEEAYIEDKAFGTISEELLKISEYFEVIFGEMGLK